MNIERFYERLRHITVLGGGLLFAVMCGVLAGGGRFNTLGKILAAMAIVTVCLTLRGRIWVLIPLFWPLTGVIPATEWPFAIRDLAVAVTFVAFLVLMGFKVIRLKPKFDLIDLLVALNIFYMLTVFVRNPVGVKAFDSDLVGGKPYFNVFIACLAYFVLCRVPAETRIIAKLPLFLLPAPAFTALGTLVTTYSPALAGKIGLGALYSDFAPAESTVIVDELVDRKTGLMMIGITGMQVLTSYFRPLTLFMPAHFGRFFLACTFTVAVLLSGFRSGIMMIGVFIALSTFYRKIRMDLLIFVLLGAFGLSVLTLGNRTLFDLPLAAQRALSFLPGKWDEAAITDAKVSIDWRVDMWSMVWHEERWIKNKLLGDGFGFTHRELSLMQGIATGGVGFLGGAQQEAFMINGTVHNGPLSTIRYVGIVGLVFYYGFIAIIAIRGVKAIRATRGTPLFPAALFVGMPTLAYAVTYPLGVGQFDSDAPQYIFMAGLIKLVARAAEGMAGRSELPHDKWAPEDLGAQLGSTVAAGASAHRL